MVRSWISVRVLESLMDCPDLALCFLIIQRAKVNISRAVYTLSSCRYAPEYGMPLDEVQLCEQYSKIVQFLNYRYCRQSVFFSLLLSIEFNAIEKSL